jgi:hypothetical protein
MAFKETRSWSVERTKETQMALLIVILILLLLGGTGLLVFVVKSFLAAGILGIILLALLIYVLIGRPRAA